MSDAGDVAGLRAMMGVCAQSNVMAAELTCYDHLQLFARLKGVEWSYVDAAVCGVCNLNVLQQIIFHFFNFPIINH